MWEDEERETESSSCLCDLTSASCSPPIAELQSFESKILINLLNVNHAVAYKYTHAEWRSV